MKAQKALIGMANAVKAQCFKAATDLTKHSMKEAKLSEDRFLRRHGEPYAKYATLNYEDWMKQNEHTR